MRDDENVFTLHLQHPYLGYPCILEVDEQGGDCVKRRIIQIDEEKCNGCGLCVAACHEGAIGIWNGKAKLLRDDYCDGLGDCLPVCPTDAITFHEREALPYDEQAVQQNQKSKADIHISQQTGCPGSRTRIIEHEKQMPHKGQGDPEVLTSQLMNWPVQIKLMPVNAAYLKGARLLIAADCTAFAYANFHQQFTRGRITLIGCPKLDEGDYTEKLTEILKSNDIFDVVIVQMEVPCCGGLSRAAIGALQKCGKMIPWRVEIISTDGKMVEQ